MTQGLGVAAGRHKRTGHPLFSGVPLMQELHQAGSGAVDSPDTEAGAWVDGPGWL